MIIAVKRTRNVLVISVTCILFYVVLMHLLDPYLEDEHTMSISSLVDAFVAAQNNNRDGSTVALDYSALSGAVPTGDNGVSGVAGIAADGGTIALGSGYNAVLFDGANSSTPSANGQPDSYAFNVDISGTVTVTDNNTGHSETITGASYLVFDGGAQNADGSYQSIYFIEGSTNAQIASMYNAAFLRQPDLPGLEFYAKPIAAGTMTLHQAATYFLASPEFQKDYPTLTAPSDDGGPNDQAFITQLYGQILHRTPTTAEVDYYVNALQHVAGVDRAQLLIYFALSPENQSDISGWLVNTSNGDFAQPGAPLSAQTVVTDGVATGTVNTNLIGTVSASSYVNVNNTSITGNGYTDGGLLPPANGNQTFTSADHITIILSPTINSGGFMGHNDVMYGSSAGGSWISPPDTSPFAASINNGGTIYLYGTNNTIDSNNDQSGVTIPVTIHGFTNGDAIRAIMGVPVGLVVQGSSSHIINGSSYWFSGPVTYGVTQVGSLGVNVGNVADDSAATMAAAANAVYKVGDVTGENAVFFGQDPSGNTVIYHWGYGDLNHTHQVDANAFTGAEVLIGVPASAITASMFH